MGINGAENNWRTSRLRCGTTEIGEVVLPPVSGLCIRPLYLECIGGAVNPFFPLELLANNVETLCVGCKVAQSRGLRYRR